MRFAQFTDWKLMERTVERGREKKRNLTRFHFVKSRVIFSISVDNLRKEYLVHFVSSFSLDLVMFYSLTFVHLGNLIYQVYVNS